MTMELPSQHNDPSDEPYAPPERMEHLVDHEETLAKTQTLLLVSFYAVIGLGSASNIFYYENAAATYLSSIATAILLTVWASNDSYRRKGRFSSVLKLVYFITCPISVFIYLTYTRGIRGFLLACGHLMGVFAVAYVTFYITFYAIYFSGLWHLYDPIFMES